jgi:iron complex transport system substrate-binding protein
VHRSVLAFLVAFMAALVAVSFSAAASTTKPHTYHRIISLSPTITEDLFKIGAGKQVIAVDQDSNYPAAAPRTGLSGYNPNVEAISAYNPDLVFISYDPGNLKTQLEQQGIKVVMEPAAADLPDAYNEIVGVGTLTGHENQARRVVRWMKNRINDLVTSAHLHRRLHVYHELDPTYYSVTSRTFIGTIYKLFGFTNIADAAGASAGTDYPQLSNEYIVDANPQIIVLADTVCCGQNGSTLASRPGWSGISAVAHHRVIGVNDDIASRWGPRIVQFAAAIAKIARRG